MLTISDAWLPWFIGGWSIVLIFAALVGWLVVERARETRARRRRGTAIVDKARAQQQDARHREVWATDGALDVERLRAVAAADADAAHLPRRYRGLGHAEFFEAMGVERLLAEINGEADRYRHGEDITQGAPKEWTP